jgi:ElaB/YqjD/DUF883 family membrane-anchored ribosome-binding protein
MATRTNVRKAGGSGESGEMLDGARDVRDILANAIDKSLATRPYTTLGLAVAAGFLLGAIWTR